MTDNDGATNSVTHTVTVVVGTNAPPTAAFTFSPPAPSTQDQVAFNGTGSSDSDGTVTGYSWNFGDGATDTTSGASPVHTYANPGTYTVTLTVTDNGGSTNSVQHAVTVTQATSTAGPAAARRPAPGQHPPAAAQRRRRRPPSGPCRLPARGSRSRARPSRCPGRAGPVSSCAAAPGRAARER